MPLFSQHTARFSPDVPLEGTSSRELLKRYQPLETLARHAPAPPRRH